MKIKRPTKRRAKWAAATGGAAVLVTSLVVFVSPLLSTRPTPRPPRPSTTVSAGLVPAILLNPEVTQATIKTTVCIANWTDTVRPPSSYTNALKRMQLQAAGVANQTLADYEEDHWIPLSVGGSPRNVENLWPELWIDARVKDVRERALHRLVCDGSITLQAARIEMYLDWGTQTTVREREAAMSTLNDEVYVLEFWGGFKDGGRLRLVENPPKNVIFKVVPYSEQLIEHLDLSSQIQSDLIVYELTAIDDAGVYRYVERETKARMAQLKWWWE